MALAAACSWRGGGATMALRALGPMAIGPLASLAWLAALHFAGCRIGHAPAGSLALGLRSFVVAGAHGAGLMRVPAPAVWPSRAACCGADKEQFRRVCC